jgi:hypothetical protein
VIALNLVMGVLIFVLFVLSLVARTWTFTALGALPANDAESVFLGMRTIMLIGIAGVPLTHVILTRLLAMVETVRAGDPFVAENAARLQRIAWCVLGLELLHAAVAGVAAWVSTDSMPIDITWRLNVTRWITVLLLFVLARVFEHGTQMRDDLAGTI